MRFRTILLTTLAVVSTTVLGWAQPVLTPDNTVEPLVGTEVEVTQVDVSSANSLADQLVEGEDVTWDFTVADYAEPVSWMLRYHEAPFDDLPAADLPEFADANVVQEIVGSLSEDIPEETLLYLFLTVDDDALASLGFSGLVDTNDDGVADTSAVTYSPADIQLPFPVTYGDAWQGVYTQTFHLVDQTFTSGVASVSREVVGWGTLETPDGSVEALMIRKVLNLTAGEILILAVESYEFLSPLVSNPGGWRTISASVTLAGDGVSVAEASYTVTELPVADAAEDDRAIPSSISLGPNYPNPFNPSTIIPFNLEESGAATIAVYDVLGRQVATVADRVFTAGSHTVSFDAASFQSGVYRVVLRSGTEIVSRMITLQK
jgi:hypothetical protein